ncbi:MAG: SDR family oxidoreductase [Pseudomonadales bacterium]|uniref:Peroxisomal trans-2-enoyl-CoA reductase n=1 Tax=Oleiphilus messinensis TaxID=141451 RepID=A0A1Y0I8N9_9GAMM|nr:SDR family oxidoreductase [Oleiphilus messinensis]ARU55845.1 short-chain dehydrogenase/reductase SDR [Oleiphilus messinensis]MCG8611119.1 SDR family oxidoreductase [Pseudomonadales bacterium]
MPYDSVFKPDLFANQTIIVTGGGSGIGRCTAHELAHLGAHTVLIGRKLEKLQAVAAELEEDGFKCDYFSCDIRDEDSVKDVIKTIVERRGAIHGLVNNAGGQFPSPLNSINKKGWDAVVATNLTGGFLFAREAFNQSMSKTGGSIVNIVADMWGGMPGMGHSGAARAGMVNFTQTAAVEWGCAGVRVNAVAPGWIASSGMDSYPPHIKSWLQSLPDAVPIKRMGLEAEVSSAICFLLSDAAAFISGTTVRIDGAASQGTRVWPLPKAKNVTTYNGFHRAETPNVLKEKKSEQE